MRHLYLQYAAYLKKQVLYNFVNVLTQASLSKFLQKTRILVVDLVKMKS